MTLLTSRRLRAKVQKTCYNDAEAATIIVTENEVDNFIAEREEKNDEYISDDVLVGQKRRLNSSSAQLSQLDASIDSEMGVVEEIYCENFMCHRKLRVSLCPHINFITGENGSGKSAIIAAIQICLGASARSTHRGKSIKNLIRHGYEGNALVRITLRNDAVGSDAFRPENFGRRIIVERLIRRDGSAEYRLKDERGVLVSKLKTDLDAMLDHLNIQTENPCAILDQENAKLFLKGNPQDKYKFFLQSTDLYKMRTTYSKIDEETRNIAESTLKREKAKIATLEKAMEEAEKQWEDAQSIGKLEEEFEVLKKELAWSFVAEKEQSAAKMEKKMRRKKRDAELAADEYEKTKGAVDDMERKQKEKNDRLEEVNTRLNENSQRKTDVKNRIREARRPLHMCKAELKQLTQSRQRANQRLTRLQDDVQKKREDHEVMMRTRLQRNDKMREQIERKRREVHDAECELNETKEHGQTRPEELDEVDNRYDRCVRHLRDSEVEMGKTQAKINQLRGQKRDSLAVYGSRIPQLQQLIHQNRHRFSEPPIGPLGLHVKLPEKFMHFAVAIELALKGTLGSYLVVNGRDKALLDDLKRQIHCPQNQANIIISQRSGRRYNNLRLADGDLAAHAICNILEVDDDEVFNVLVDVCNCESKLLFETRQSAEKSVLSGSSGNFRMARFVTEVYLPNGDKFVVRSGNLAFIANKGNRRSSIICHDVDGEITELNKKLNFLQGNMDVLRRDEARLRQHREDFRRQIKEQNDRIDYLSRRFNQRSAELRRLEDELTDDMQQHTLDTSVLEDEVRSVKIELEEFNRREEELNEILAKTNPDLEGQLRELEELDAIEKEIAAAMNEFQEDADAVYKQLSEMKVKEMTYQKEAAAMRDMVEQWEDELAALQEECEEQRQKAQLHCERVVVRHSHDYYGKRLTDIKHQIEHERSRFQGMDLAELRDDLETKKIKYRKKKYNFDKFRDNLERIRTMLEERKRVWQILRKEIAHRTSMEFNKYMCLNNFAGKLKFRHDDQRLDIAVLHNEVGASRESQVTDMKELSGGERSYTQVSLLLALGESIECPFRVMDEFDVFMDSVNRDMTIQLLVDAAKKDGKKQFIFVTPNDLSALRRDPMVKIQKMNPPRDRLNAERD
ncbi:structural maintenance of chromosomes protein [Plasmopara halstedii]|uniref:Structural maintenance of chromosomes protein n=1 Tax=Plasmopara halstedii TaxID=4781 RepID=A0A0P1A8E8_PLAHL|nr:structural maintenance of chromosomes protein [Plasmopara halstedii]CEG36529.1 structural maintenance of chromosomes protein [Plasmopara halstedii]|eukprot:XP_024572898.1 structural maintenance of chromosomes protein [Plasmopara halstedii]